MLTVTISHYYHYYENGCTRDGWGELLLHVSLQTWQWMHSGWVRLVVIRLPVYTQWLSPGWVRLTVITRAPTDVRSVKLQGWVRLTDILYLAYLQKCKRVYYGLADVNSYGSMSLCPGFIASRVHWVPGSMTVIATFMQLLLQLFFGGQLLATFFFWQLFFLQRFCNC